MTETIKLCPVDLCSYITDVSAYLMLWNYISDVAAHLILCNYISDVAPHLILCYFISDVAPHLILCDYSAFLHLSRNMSRCTLSVPNCTV